jgi:hypothetical protein
MVYERSTLAATSQVTALAQALRYASFRRPNEKLELERAEFNVLNGAEKLFTHSRPHLICEVHDPANASFVEAWLKIRAYELRWLDTNSGFPRQLLAAPK